MAHPIRTAERERAERKASAQALVDFFAAHHPEILAKHRAECLEAAVKRGLSDDAAVNDAWRHLIARLQFLKSKSSS